MSDAAQAQPRAQQTWRREVYLVLALSLGQAAVYSVVAIVARLTEPGTLRSQVATLNRSLSPRPLLDLAYNLLAIGFALIPVVLALHFLSGSPEGIPGPLRDGRQRIGLCLTDRVSAVRELGWGAGLAALVGIPGLGLYLVARALGINATVVPTAIGAHWWTLPVLVLSAVQNALLEEVVVVGFLITRCRQLGLSSPVAVAVSAVLRGSYHLYQGFGAFLGNAIMGALFGAVFLRRRTVLPLVIAHGLIDTVAFLGYALLKDTLNLP